MLWIVLLVVVSFFSVIGVMEFLMCILEFTATRRVKSVRNIHIRADLSGNEPHVEFLLGTLMLMAERISFKDPTTVCIQDAGMDAETLGRVREYVKENPNVILIEKEEDI